MTNEQAALAAATAIDALVDLHGNPDHISRKTAIRAASEGRPAFWSTALYHDQAARNYLDEANDLGAVDALSMRISHGKANSAESQRLINSLIPINPEAVAHINAVRAVLSSKGEF